MSKDQKTFVKEFGKGFAIGFTVTYVTLWGVGMLIRSAIEE